MFDLIAVFNDTSKHCCSDPVLMRSIENTKKGQFITESSSDLPEPPSEHRFKATPHNCEVNENMI